MQISLIVNTRFKQCQKKIQGNQPLFLFVCLFRLRLFFLEIAVFLFFGLVRFSFAVGFGILLSGTLSQVKLSSFASASSMHSLKE